MAITPWRIEWKAISTRIEGLMRAAEFFYHSIQKNSGGSDSTKKKVLSPESKKLYDLLESYSQNYEGILPAQVLELLNRFLNDFKNSFTEKNTVADDVIGLRLTALSAFRAEFEYCLVDIQDQIRTIAERAFEHLQRCIVADEEYKKKWQKAFIEDKEPGCEKLGSVHLLWHGIWAFKVVGEGERTDLVMGEQVDNPTVERTSVGMVLTEWKRAKNSNEVDKLYEKGKDQASKYTAGVLGGVELTDTRYVVVVTENAATHKDDFDDKNGITYRFINIAVKPIVPSKAALSKT